jgi:hypothetical protein
MEYIEEDTSNYISEELPFIDEVIEDRVDSEIKLMLEGDSVRGIISDLIDQKLALFLQDMKIKEYHRGPGRGKIGRTSRKFSASLPQDLFEEVKSLSGLFSSHLEASLRLYLKIVKDGS